VTTDPESWFSLFDALPEDRDLDRVRAVAAVPGILDLQDEWGMTALHVAVATNWPEAVELLLSLGADTEPRYHRTGETALSSAVRQRQIPLVRALLAAGANPDAAPYGGLSARDAAARVGLADLFVGIPERDVSPPPFRIQNAEHLAEFHRPAFDIPSRADRESLAVGRAVDVHVHGRLKRADVKVRIFEVEGSGASVRYRARLDPPVQETNLPDDVAELVFGPEHVATIYVPRPR
jgi:hypothetical protein